MAASSSPGRAAVWIAREGVVAAGSVELFGHLRQCCSHYVVVMNVRPDRLDGIEPHLVDEIEIARRQFGVVGAEMKGVGAAAAVVDDEPHAVEVAGVAALPRFAQQARLRFAPTASTIRRRRRPTPAAEARRPPSRRRRCRPGRSAGGPWRSWRSASAMTRENSACSLGRRVARRAGLRSRHRAPTSAYGHDDDVAIARQRRARG